MERISIGILILSALVPIVIGVVASFLGRYFAKLDKRIQQQPPSSDEHEGETLIIGSNRSVEKITQTIHFYPLRLRYVLYYEKPNNQRAPKQPPFNHKRKNKTLIITSSGTTVGPTMQEICTSSFL